MTEFEKLIASSALEAAVVMGQLFDYKSIQVSGVFNELSMTLAGHTYGDEEEATAQIVFAESSIEDSPIKGERLTRVSDGMIFKVISFDHKMGSYKLNVKRVGKSNG